MPRLEGGSSTEALPIRHKQEGFIDMSVGPEIRRIALSVRGARPTPWGGDGQWAWRSALWAEARRARTNNPPLGVHVLTDFTVRIKLYLADPAYRQSDVDNLAKPILDTLFTEIRSQAPVDNVTGALFDAYDSQVMTLTVSKSPVVRDEVGADVEVTWVHGEMGTLPQGS